MINPRPNHIFTHFQGVWGIYPVDIKERPKIPLLSTQVNVVISTVAEITIIQKYLNEEKTPIEALYKFPTNNEYSVTSMEFSMDGKTILTKIMEKKEAKEKYDDAIAAGNSAVKMNIDEKNPDVLSINIGRLKSKSEATITVKMVCVLSTAYDSMY
jgi:hypothetical protein